MPLARYDLFEKELLELVKKNPGKSPSEIAKLAKCGNCTAQQHLKRLAQEGKITSKRISKEGALRNYYLYFSISKK